MRDHDFEALNGLCLVVLVGASEPAQLERPSAPGPH